MNIKDQLKAFEKTPHFKELVAHKMKSDPNFGISSKKGGSKEAIMSYGNEMREYLHNETLNVESITARESFSNYIIKENFAPNIGWTVDVSFDKNETHRESLYPKVYKDGAYLNEIFNEGYETNSYVYGDKNAKYPRSLKEREGSYFVQKAVEKFNAKYKGAATAKYNSRYSGGTL